MLTQAAKLIRGIRRDASHTDFSTNLFVNQDVMLANLDVLSADVPCRMAQACRYAPQAAAASTAALYAHNDPCLPVVDVELSAV